MGESGGQPELAALNGEPLVGQLHVLHAGQYGATPDGHGLLALLRPVRLRAPRRRLDLGQEQRV